MKLADWLRLPDPQTGKPRRKSHLARVVGVHPTMITEYAEGRIFPPRDRQERIFHATRGDVTPNDFCSLAPPDASESIEAVE